MPGTRVIHTGGENPFKPMCGSTKKKDPLITFEKWKISCPECLNMMKAAMVIEAVKHPTTHTAHLVGCKGVDVPEFCDCGATEYVPF